MHAVLKMRPRGPDCTHQSVSTYWTDSWASKRFKHLTLQSLVLGMVERIAHAVKALALR